jgi:hypothetical protein
MITKSTFFSHACRAAALSFLLAGSASLMHAQQSASVDSSPNSPFLLASLSAPLDSTSSSSSSSDSSMTSDGRFKLNFDSLDSNQPPPRRRYGRPNYSDSHSNPDGSPKFAFIAGGGLSLTVGNTHKYNTPSYSFQVGAGRNFSKSLGVLMQFDYDHFGLQGKTLANQSYLYDYGCPSGSVAAGTCGVAGLDGNAHVWSFTLDPTFTLATEGSMGAYVVAGGGFYHKVTIFTEPGTGTYCDPYYGCYQYTANQTIDHYTSNAGGVNGGLGLTWKFSKFSNQRFYMEGRYVVIFNQYRPGVTSASSTATLNAYSGYNLYPQNSSRTTLIPINFGIRF